MSKTFFQLGFVQPAPIVTDGEPGRISKVDKADRDFRAFRRIEHRVFEQVAQDYLNLLWIHHQLDLILGFQGDANRPEAVWRVPVRHTPAATRKYSSAFVRPVCGAVPGERP